MEGAEQDIRRYRGGYGGAVGLVTRNVADVIIKVAGENVANKVNNLGNTFNLIVEVALPCDCHASCTASSLVARGSRIPHFLTPSSSVVENEELHTKSS